VYLLRQVAKVADLQKTLLENEARMAPFSGKTHRLLHVLEITLLMHMSFCLTGSQRSTHRESALCRQSNARAKADASFNEPAAKEEEELNDDDEGVREP
jgi:hypothetical protein